MRFAHVNNDGTIEKIGTPPGSARRLDTGQWVSPPGGVWPEELAIECGWVPVTDTPPPDFDPDTQVRSSEYQVNGARTVVTKVWTIGDLPAERIAEIAEAKERKARLDRGLGKSTNAISLPELAQLVADLIAERDG